ncbi:MAG TPA: hypothetical protein VEV17_03860 [Bryobacteraceae bacterium]|nr:hypothetical protein [Bryobacteraceae bacterium]
MSRPVFQLALAALILAPAIGRAQSDPGLWRFVHPNAKAVISVNWSRMQQSHIGAMIREKFVDSPTAPPIPGIEFLKDIDRFLLSSPGRNPDDPSPDAPMLIAIGGHFDLAKMRSLLARQGAKPQQFNSFQVYRPQGKDARDLAFVLFDPQTILIGDSRSVFAGLERSAFPAPPPDANSLLARAAQMESSYDAWAILNAPGALASDRLTALLSGADLDERVQGFELGLSMRNGLAADVALGFETEAAAKKMAGELSKIMKLAVKDKLGEPALLDLEKKLKFTSEGTQAKLTLRLTPQELEKNAQIFAASRKQAPAGVADIRPVIKQSPAPQPAEKKVIRIEGLDSGPREIPYKDQ